jgi:hypothetical protein
LVITQLMNLVWCRFSTCRSGTGHWRGADQCAVAAGRLIRLGNYRARLAQFELCRSSVPRHS